MLTVSFSGVLVIALVAVAVPVVTALVPRLPVPGAVLEVMAGIVIGPAVLGWVHLDPSIQVLSDLGPGHAAVPGRPGDRRGRVAGSRWAASPAGLSWCRSCSAWPAPSCSAASAWAPDRSS